MIILPHNHGNIGLTQIEGCPACHFNQGYLQAMDLMMAHWPEDRKCKCNPVLSGVYPCPITDCVVHTTGKMHIGPCHNYCWVQQVYQTSAKNAGEERT